VPKTGNEPALNCGELVAVAEGFEPYSAALKMRLAAKRYH
jgi:hypothetical protein